MMTDIYNWSVRALWGVMAIAGLWLFTVACIDYNACRAIADSTPVGCFLMTVLFGTVKAICFAFLSALKILTFVLP
jgi:hypothetical protein